MLDLVTRKGIPRAFPPLMRIVYKNMEILGTSYPCMARESLPSKLVFYNHTYL